MACHKHGRRNFCGAHYAKCAHLGTPHVPPLLKHAQPVAAANWPATRRRPTKETLQLCLLHPGPVSNLAAANMPATHRPSTKGTLQLCLLPSDPCRSNPSLSRKELWHSTDLHPHNRSQLLAHLQGILPSNNCASLATPCATHDLPLNPTMLHMTCAFSCSQRP